MAVYAVVVFSALAWTPLWLDEILQFGKKRDISIGELIAWVQLNAGASPLPYLFQHGVVSLTGYSVFAARVPAALCSVFSGALFAAVSQRFLSRGRLLALAAFLLLPLQFRYGLEARVYSQGLLCTLLSMWLFLKLEERPSRALASLYGLSVALGLYSQPLTIFPILAQALAARKSLRFTLPAAAAGVLSFLPWFILQRQAQAAHNLTGATFFSWRQIAPQVLLHDLAGGGYAASLPLLILAAFAFALGPRLLWLTLVAALAGPILMDAVFNYFFADRQLLFAMPALVLLAAQGVERLRNAKAGLVIAALLLAVYAGAAAVRDIHLATMPKDDLAATADAIVAELRQDACFMTAPLTQADLYTFLRPELERRECGSQPAGPILLVASQYTQPAELGSTEASLAAQYRRIGSTKAGRSELTIWERR